MRFGVHKHYGVRRHFWVVRLDPILDGRVEIVCRRLLYEHRLRERLRMRLRMRGRRLERVEECFRRRRFELEIDGSTGVRR